MILNQVNLPKVASLFAGLHRGKYLINTEIIKQYQKQLQKSSPSALRQYPKTFQEKVMIVNDTKTVQLLEVVEFGVKYKKGTNWLPLLLASLALAGYLLDRILPIRVTDRYFMISPESSTYISGYLFAGFNFEKPFYLYLPLMLGVRQLSRFVSMGHLGTLLFVNCICGDILGQYLVNQRVKEYEIWTNERLCFGEGNLLSIMYAFWAYIGLKDAFTHLKSRLFLKTVKGKGVVRRGLPFGYLCLFYSALQIFFYTKRAKNSEVILAQVMAGIIMGLILRRVKPILK